MRCIEHWAFNWETDVWLNSRENDNRADTEHTHNSQWKTNLRSPSLVVCTYQITLQMRAYQSDQVLKLIQIMCMWICLNEPAKAILFRCFKYITIYLFFSSVWFGLWFFNPFCCCPNFIFAIFWFLFVSSTHRSFYFHSHFNQFSSIFAFGMWQLQEFRKHYEIHRRIEGVTMSKTIFRSISNCKWYAQ